MILLNLASLRGDSLILLDSNWRWQRGSSEASSPDPTAWRQIGFPDGGWSSSPAPFWYGDAQPAPGTELTDMRDAYTCIFLRQTFVVDFPADVASLTLGAQSDDGFIAWINGREVARFNMPDADPPHDGSSLPALGEPIPFQTFQRDDLRDDLVAGVNVLAVQAFNASLSGSSDFVINVSLDSVGDTSPPVIETIIPPAGAVVRSLNSIEVVFSEGVTGVDASDLLVNNQPATGLVVFTDRQYVFEFPEPAPGPVNVTWDAGHGITDLAGSPHPFSGGAWSYTLDPNAPPPGVIISEFLADNDGTLNDEDGDASDWIELHNAAGTPVDLGGWYLTDQTNNLALWRIPSVTLAPGGYLVVFASGKDRANPAAPLHTSFSLDKDGGYLALTDRDLEIISEYRFYPGQIEDVSYGRDQFSASVLGYFPQPTPGAPNSQGGAGFAPPVVFSRPGGTFLTSWSLTLSTVDPAAEIRYTLDGSPPTQGSILYSGPIDISTAVLVRARSFVNGLLPGAVRSEGYVPLSPTVVNTTSDLPLMILHNFGAGTIPANVDQPAWLMVFEPGANGRSSMTNAPELGVRAGINIRGSSTQGYPKSSYAVEAWDEVNEDRDVEVLGLPAESDWVFYAPNNFEPVLIHNPFAHQLSRDAGRYSSRTRFAELYVSTAAGAISSSHYRGIYVIEEKIKRGPDRVDIDRLEPEHVSPPQVTGGYLMKIDRADADERPFFAAGQGIVYQDPPGPEIQLPQRDPQAQYLQNYMDSFGTALDGSSFRDPVVGFRAYVDVDSWIDHHLLNVLTFNVDALRLSTWFYKARGGKLEFGPLWDFDRALGSTDGRDANPRVWRSTVSDRGTDFFNYPWWGRMFQDEDFWQRYIDRYQEFRAAEFSMTHLHGLVDRFTGELREAQPREVQRWSGHAPRGGSYTAEINLMKNWLSNRVNFMDTNFLDRPSLSAPGGPINPGFQITLTPASKSGSYTVYTTNGIDPRLSGGGIATGARSNLGPVTLTLNSNARIVARSLNAVHRNLTGPNNPPISTPWSGVTAATYVVQTPRLVITELMYHPPPPPAGNTNSAEAFEYVELRNVGASTLNLRGFRLSGGIDFTFANDSFLAAGQRIVVVADQPAFESRYGTGLPVAGVYTRQLANAGDRLVLEGPLGEPILDFRYDDAWFPVTDGLGFSLAVVDDAATPTNWTLPTHWRAAGPYLGTPGAVESPIPNLPNVVVEEALTHTDPPQVDTVELFNPGPAPADIGGWLLSDDFGSPMKFRIPQGTILDAGQFKTYTETELNSGTDGFLLSSTGDEIYLFSADANTNLTGYVHGFAFGAAQNGFSFGRHVNSQGTEHFVAQRLTTLEAPNSGPRVGPIVISEIMFHPPPVYSTNNNTRDEFIELRNITSVDQPLHDPLAATNTWRLDGGVEFELPRDLVLQPGGHLVVVGFDPILRPGDLAAFRSAYALGGGVTIVGPFRGRLENDGERIQLLKPDPPQSVPGPDFGSVPYVLVEALHYAVTPPWPTDANATGRSLHRVEPTTYGNDPTNWVSALPTPGTSPGPPNPDVDADGLPDVWETDHGLRADRATGDDGPDGDPDGDGLTNLEEYQAGTHPTDGSSYLKLASVSAEDTAVRLRFMAVAGLTYSVLYRDDVEPGVWTHLADVPAQPITTEVEVIDPAGPAQVQRYYRLVTP